MVFKSSFLKFVFSCNCTIYFKDFLKRISMWHSLETKLVALPNDNVAGSEYRSGVVVKMGAELAWSLELQAWGWACWWGFNGSVYVKLQISFALRQTISAFNYIDYAAKERIWLSLRPLSCFTSFLPRNFRCNIELDFATNCRLSRRPLEWMGCRMEEAFAQQACHCCWMLFAVTTLNTFMLCQCRRKKPCGCQHFSACCKS